MYPILLVLTLALFGLVAWRSRPLAIALIAAALPTYLLRFTILGVPVTLLEALILALVAVWIARGEWKRVCDVPRPWLYAAGALLLAAIVATATSFDRHAALGILKAYFFEPMLLFLIAVTTVKTAEEKERILLAFGLGAAAVSLFGLFQRVTGIAIPIPWDVELRATGVFPYPNALGLYAGPAVVIAGFRLWRLASETTSNTKVVIAWTFIFALCAAGIVVAQSEAAGAAVLVTLFLCSLASARLRRFTIPIAVVALAVTLAVPSTRSYLIQKATFRDSSEQVRLGQWQETWAMLKDYPIFGAGLAGYPVAFAPYHAHVENEIFQYPHTLIFNVCSELGLLGLAAFAFLALVVMKAARAARTHQDKLFALAAFAALLEMSIHGLADVPYFKNDLSALVWLLLALICLSSSYGRRDSAKI